jgi:hypothetical protein
MYPEMAPDPAPTARKPFLGPEAGLGFILAGGLWLLVGLKDLLSEDLNRGAAYLAGYLSAWLVPGVVCVLLGVWLRRRPSGTRNP